MGGSGEKGDKGGGESEPPLQKSAEGGFLRQRQVGVREVGAREVRGRRAVGRGRGGVRVEERRGEFGVAEEREGEGDGAGCRGGCRREDLT